MHELRHSHLGSNISPRSPSDFRTATPALPAGVPASAGQRCDRRYQRHARHHRRTPWESALSGRRFHCAAGHSAGQRASWPVGRVLCTRSRGPAAIHLGLPLPAASCGLPASIGRAALKRSRRDARRGARPLLTLLRVGFTEPPGSLRALVVSYTTVSPLPPANRGRSVFCGTFPRVTPGRRYRPPCPAEPGPSSTPPGSQAGAAAARPARPLLYPG